MPRPARSTGGPHARGDGPSATLSVNCALTRSPRAWGWTVRQRCDLQPGCEVPTRVGMDRTLSTLSSGSSRGPHARGDGPHRKDKRKPKMPRSPRAWGWTDQRVEQDRGSEEVPTRVGMDRWSRPSPRTRRRGPHARGDGPVYAGRPENTMGRSPRAWGWTVATRAVQPLPVEVPTRVGMDRGCCDRARCGSRGPHARGDGPLGTGVRPGEAMRSPRAWGWTAPRPHALAGQAEVPTRVGMDRRCGSSTPATSRGPHARGDGPGEIVLDRDIPARSPRAWGWTGHRRSRLSRDAEVPTRVGMDRRFGRGPAWRLGGPHARGDGPIQNTLYPDQSERSPRAWGWTVWM